MRKNLLIACLAIFIISSFVALSFAGTNERMTTKIDRGGKKIITSPLEIPKAIVQTTKESNIIFGLLFGPIRGVCNFFSKAVSGGVDVVGCNMGDPKEEYIKPQMVAE